MTDALDLSKAAPSIDVKNLTYLFPDGSSGLKEVFLDLPPGSRTLLIGGERICFVIEDVLLTTRSQRCG